jgi:ferritin-like metal-binding protein YciE
MALKTMQDLFEHELQDLYSAEQQIIQALPEMMQATSNQELKNAFQQHLEETKGQVQRLEQIAQQVGINPQGEQCKAMAGLIEEGRTLLNEQAEPAVLDAALIGAAQRIEHYEIAGYGTARTFARTLGNQEAAQLLQQTLEEEAQTDEKLTRLAEQNVNKQAKQAGA